jgi:hypothetical protein
MTKRARKFAWADTYSDTPTPCTCCQKPTHLRDHSERCPRCSPLAPWLTHLCPVRGDDTSS